MVSTLNLYAASTFVSKTGNDACTSNAAESSTAIASSRAKRPSLRPRSLSLTHALSTMVHSAYEALHPRLVGGVAAARAEHELRHGVLLPLDAFNEWVRVSSDAPCTRYTETHEGERPHWGVTGEHSEDFTRHVACCHSGDLGEGTVSPSAVAKENESVGTENLEESVASASIAGNVPPGDEVVEYKVAAENNPISGTNHADVAEKYAPQWFQRDEESAGGWVGRSYVDAISHCARHGSSIPCPYEACEFRSFRFGC